MRFPCGYGAVSPASLNRVETKKDVTGKELSWHAVRKAREQESTYLGELAVCEKVDEREAIAQYQVTPVDTKWVDTDKVFEEEHMHIRFRIVARENLK